MENIHDTRQATDKIWRDLDQCLWDNIRAAVWAQMETSPKLSEEVNLFIEREKLEYLYEIS